MLVLDDPFEAKSDLLNFKKKKITKKNMTHYVWGWYTK